MIDKETVRKLPKIDLHRHLDGDVRPEVLCSIAQEDGIEIEHEGLKVPFHSPGELDSYFTRLRKDGFIALLEKGFSVVTRLMQTRKNLHKVAFEEVRNLADDGIVYAELRFAPQYHTGESEFYKHAGQAGPGIEKLTIKQIIQSVFEGLKEGEERFGIKTRIIVCIGREIKAERGIEIVQEALKCTGYGVVGIDLACDEASHPPEKHAPAYNITVDTPIKRTVHAGEFGNQLYRNMQTAINELHANRLGHAIPLSQHPDLIELVRERGVGIEMCPTSNIYCGYIKSAAELRIRELLAAGVSVSINTDDPRMFGYTLTDVLHDLIKGNHLTMDEIIEVQKIAIRTAFLPPKEKEKLLETHYR